MFSDLRDWLEYRAGPFLAVLLFLTALLGPLAFTLMGPILLYVFGGFLLVAVLASIGSRVLSRFL